MNNYWMVNAVKPGKNCDAFSKVPNLNACLDEIIANNVNLSEYQAESQQLDSQMHPEEVASLKDVCSNYLKQIGNNFQLDMANMKQEITGKPSAELGVMHHCLKSIGSALSKFSYHLHHKDIQDEYVKISHIFVRYALFGPITGKIYKLQCDRKDQTTAIQNLKMLMNHMKHVSLLPKCDPQKKLAITKTAWVHAHKRFLQSTLHFFEPDPTMCKKRGVSPDGSDKTSDMSIGSSDSPKPIHDIKWHIQHPKTGKPVAPTVMKLRRYFKNGTINPQTWVWQPEFGDSWKTIEQAGLLEALQA